MKYLNTKINLNFLLTFFFIKIIFINSSVVFSCEDLKFKKSTIWFENENKVKDIIIVELAETKVKRKQGLQCRKQMSKKEGMLFIWKKEDFRVFWMNKTFIPLDIIFFDQNKKIFDFFLNAKPMDKSPIFSNGKAQYVLELNAGEFRNLDLKLGQKLFFDNKR